MQLQRRFLLLQRLLLLQVQLQTLFRLLLVLLVRQRLLLVVLVLAQVNLARLRPIHMPSPPLPAGEQEDLPP